jgi:hypothetical protein
MSHASFQKRMREKARQDKARAKRQRRDDRAAAAADAPVEGDDTPVAPQREVLAELADLHERFDSDHIDFDEFERRKHDLLARLDV